MIILIFIIFIIYNFLNFLLNYKCQEKCTTTNNKCKAYNLSQPAAILTRYVIIVRLFDESESNEYTFNSFPRYFISKDLPTYHGKLSKIMTMKTRNHTRLR